MKKTSLIALAAIALCGCSTTNITKLVEAASKDPAAVQIRVTSIYGTVTYQRANPGTNNLTVGDHGISTQ